MENYFEKYRKISRETGDLKAETDEGQKEPDIGMFLESYFNMPSDYSSSKTLADSYFVYYGEDLCDIHHHGYEP